MPVYSIMLYRMTFSIILIGYRGTGKTTVARGLSTRLDVPFFDSDAVIQRQADKTIAEIFAQDGESAFRDLEESVIATILNQTNPTVSKGLILATGGGAVLRQTTRHTLRQSGRVFWLKALPETILQRISDDAASQTMRPSLTSLPMMDEIITLLNQREKLYAETAHEMIDTDIYPAEDIVQMIAEKIMSISNEE